MLKFNSSHIIVGQIKELLASFNLPKYRVYTRENQIYHELAVKYNEKIAQHPESYKKIPEEINIISTVKKSDSTIHTRYVPYIKENKLQCFVNSSNDPSSPNWQWEDFASNSFTYNDNIPNWTKSLEIKNNIYDSYTHEYLGDFLRFIRDYNNINIMSMYNCFSNRICSELHYNWTALNTGTNSKQEISFTTNTTGYKIYMLPVKLFKEYTIAIDSDTPVEICCGLYGKYQDTREKVLNIPGITYKKYNRLAFSSPVLYDLLTSIGNELKSTSMSELAQNEADLKMFIKVATSCTSSIVVLEGNYLNYNDSILKFEESGLKRVQNHTITNFEQKDKYYIYDERWKDEESKYEILEENYQTFEKFKPISAIQLLRANTKESYPFSDRLLEYLTDNAITSEETLVDNIKRIQKIINLNNSYPDTELDYSEYAEGRKNKKEFLLKDLIQPSTPAWTNSVRPILYDKFNMIIKANINDINHDILGYADKDIENWYRANTTNEITPKYVTLSAVELNTETNGLYKEEE